MDTGVFTVTVAKAPGELHVPLVTLAEYVVVAAGAAYTLSGMFLQHMVLLILHY
jgi:hypothetical protein